MIERRLVRQLEKAAARFRHLRLVISWSVVWTLAALVALFLLGLNQSVGWFSALAVPTIAGVAALVALIAGVAAMRTARDYRNIAQRVEDAYPALNSGLLAAVAQQPQLPNGRFSYLQSTVIQDALHHAYAYSWKRVVPWSKLATAHLAHFCAFVLFVGSLVVLNRQVPRVFAAAVEQSELPNVVASNEFEVSIDPGDTEVERGAGLLVQARFSGIAPLEATLVYEAAGETVRLPMLQPLEDAVFGGRIREVAAPLSYRVEFADSTSETFRVTVFEYPTLVRADANLTFPDYTSLEQRLVQDVRRVSAVEGTTLELRCYLNKQVETAELVSKGIDPIALKLVDESEALYVAELVLTESRRFRLELVDSDGRKNKQPPQISVNVLPNKPPDLKLVQPSRDMRVSPVEELDLKANVWDDFGVSRFGLAYAFGGAEPVDVLLGQSAAAKQRTLIEHLVAFEELEAEPDQLMSYHFWAEDTGPDGQTRRVSSDMYFAEVRHFEEIFREGQSPPGGEPQEQSEQAKQAAELAELQKQIINGTWKVVRREIRDVPSDSFGEDAKLLAESQADAMAQVEKLAAELTDAASQKFVKEVLLHMGKALVELSEAEQTLAISKARSSLSPEQAAYQALLKLRAREFEVTRSQQSSKSQSSSSSASRQQQQLQQLELDNEENRYETEQDARSEQEQQARENRQVLNRLGELARRQSDLNERLKELQSALEEAESEAEREEIRKQLKRLQEEQQQVLRDTEELQERMERPENQEQMAEAREQLEETRENVRQASEALEEGRVSRALASGTRAENDLDELRDEFRRRASGQFSDEMREMRDEARELDAAERQLSEELAGLNDPKNRPSSLRDTGDREEIVKQLEQQTERTRELLDRMQETVLEAEETEPLLADRLYEAARQARQQELDSTLNTARRMLEYGFVDDAKREEAAARQGIDELREGIERAAEGVLGDETEALRRAREALEELNDQLAGELSRENPQANGDPVAGERESEGNEPNAENARGEVAGSHQDRSGRQPSETDDSEGLAPSQESAQQREPTKSDGDPQAQGESSQGEPSASESQPPSSPSGQQPPSDSQQSDQPSQGSGQPGESPSRQGKSSDSPSPGQQQSPSNAQGQPSQSSSGQPQNGMRQAGNSRSGFEQAFSTNTGGTNRVAPIGGDDFVEWSDRLRDVEEMLDDPELRAEAARIRDRARGFRIELKRHSKEPSWDLVELQVAKPLAELRDRVVEELLRRSGEDTAVPLDRDPVPTRFTEQVRRYYEQLGSGE